MKKKYLSLILAVAMAFTSSVFAFAAEEIELDDSVVDEAVGIDEIIIDDTNDEFVEEVFITEDEADTSEESDFSAVTIDAITDFSAEDAVAAADEPNTYKEAKLVKSIKSTTNGESKDYSDQDWFKFKTGKSAKYSIVFSAATADITVNFAEVNQFGLHNIDSINVPAKDSKTLTVELSGDTYYYINVMGVTEYETKYTFKAKSVKNLNLEASIKKVKKTKNSLTLTLKKPTKAFQVLVKYSTRKDMKGAKTVTFQPKNKTFQINGLKPGKKYYVQVNGLALKTNNNVYGKWSKVYTYTLPKK